MAFAMPTPDDPASGTEPGAEPGAAPGAEPGAESAEAAKAATAEAYGAVGETAHLIGDRGHPHPTRLDPRTRTDG